jgi:hypothetical protein
MGTCKMDAQSTKLQAAENDLKQLMAEVTRAMHKAQDAIARIAPKTVRETAPETAPTSTETVSATPTH